MHARCDRARRAVCRCTAFYQDVEMPKWKPVGCQCRHRSIHAVLGCNLDRIRLHLFRTSVRAAPALAPRIHANPARDSTTNAGIPTHPALDVASYGCSPVKPRPRPRPRRDLQIDNSTPRLPYQLIRWMVGSRLSGPSFLCARSLCHGSHTQNH